MDLNLVEDFITEHNETSIYFETIEAFKQHRPWVYEIPLEDVVYYFKTLELERIRRS